MSRAKRPEIEELLTLLFDEIEPRKDEYVGDYRRRIETQLRKRLKFRIDILKRDWFKRRIQVAFETSQKRLQENNAHVTTSLCVNSFYELKIALTEAGCSDDASSDPMSLNSDDRSFIASESEILKDAQLAAKLQKKENEAFLESETISEESDPMSIDHFLYDDVDDAEKVFYNGTKESNDSQSLYLYFLLNHHLLKHHLLKIHL